LAVRSSETTGCRALPLGLRPATPTSSIRVASKPRRLTRVVCHSTGMAELSVAVGVTGVTFPAPPLPAYPYDRYRWEPEPPAGKGWAITNRALSFGGQSLFPPDIDLVKRPTPGTWFDLFVYDGDNPCTEGSGPSRGGNRTCGSQTGIVWFPGSAPLYKARNPEQR
jgi:hypothetical protein